MVKTDEVEKPIKLQKNVTLKLVLILKRPWKH